MKLKCSICGKGFETDKFLLECPLCRGSLIFEYDNEFRGDLISSGDWSIWRYSLLPVNKEKRVSLGEGVTPLNLASNLSKEVGFNGRLLLKNEAVNPTGSFIDRGISLVVTHALSMGYKKLVTASPGNLGASLSAYAAKAGMTALIYIPYNIESGKLYQILMYKGNVAKVKNLEEGGRKARELVDLGYYPVFTNNPYYFEGVKTIAYEIIEALDWRSPDIVVTPMGSGALIYSIYKGFREGLEKKVINRIPRFVGVQVKGSSFIADRLLGKDEKDEDEAVPELSFKVPLNVNLAIKAIRESGGEAVKVNHEDVVKGLEMLSEKEGILVEMAAAATIAGLEKVIDRYDAETVICILTGEGLKDPATARELTRKVGGRLDIGYEGVSRIGKTKLRILRGIIEGYNYGYALWKYLSDKGVKITLPTIYQHLMELEKMKLIKLVSKTGLTKQKAIYQLTKRGRDILKYV